MSTPANLTYIRHRVREGIPDRPRAWENFAESVERACDELQDYREVLGPLVGAAKALLADDTHYVPLPYRDDLEAAIAKAEGRA